MVYVILADGFEEIEALAPVDILRRGGVEVRTAGAFGTEVTGGHGVQVKADCLLEDVELDRAEMIVIPGGLKGTETLEKTQPVLELLKRANERGLLLAAICAAPRVLKEAGLMEGKRCVCHPAHVQYMQASRVLDGPYAVRDGNIITGKGAGASLDYGFELLAALRGDDAAAEIAGKMVWDRQQPRT
ncbi:MAG: DJ-1/PfpI family protein [Oscillospiraceae bacterium]|nr:DJ-1/PfpI family protein [Oscillospiraceae bacterium]